MLEKKNCRTVPQDYFLNNNCILGIGKNLFYETVLLFRVVYVMLYLN
jgi:hypothetical protein